MVNMRHETSDPRYEAQDSGFRKRFVGKINLPLSLSPYLRVSLFLCLLLSLFFFVPCPVQGRGTGTSGSAALKIGVGARATGMGEASVAAADDVTSIYWNPAGLFQVRGSQLSAMHIEWLDDIRYEWVGYAQPVASWAAIAADVSYLHMGSIVRTIESPTEGYEENGTFSASDVAGRIAIAGKALKGVIIGASLQVFQSNVDFEDLTKERIEDKTAKSTTIGLGCLYNPPVSGLTVGGSIQNWGRQTQAFIKEKEPLPFTFRIGAAYKALVRGWRPESPEAGASEENAADSDAGLDKLPGALLAALDLDFPIDSSPGVRMGLEYRFSNGIAIRSGYRTGTGFSFPSGFCGGMGYNTDTYQVDYALVPYGDLGNTHRVSFTIRF